MSGDTIMRRGAVIRLVAGREIRERLRAKSFAVGTAFLVIVILGMGVVSRLAGNDTPGTIHVAVAASRSDEIVATISGSAAAVDRDAKVTFFPDAAAARAALAKGDADVALLAGEKRVVFEGDVDQEVLAVVQQAWSLREARQRMDAAGLSPRQITEVLSIAPLEVANLDGDEGTSGVGVLAGTLAAILLFLSLQTFGSYVLTGVVEEKSTAVVEVLLVRARADQLLAGKLIGIGAAGLAQFALAVAAGLGSLVISGVTIPPEIWPTLPMTVLWFLGGYALYSTLFALAGSLVSRQEDAQAAAAPITYTLVGAYLLVFVFGYMPESTVSRVMSLVPPIAPLLMPMRMAAGAASVIEVVVALALLLIATVAAWKLAGRIYEQVLLRRGSRIGWRDALSLRRR